MKSQQLPLVHHPEAFYKDDTSRNAGGSSVGWIPLPVELPGSPEAADCRISSHACFSTAQVW